jgi:hypothetical protein
VVSENESETFHDDRLREEFVFSGNETDQIVPCLQSDTDVIFLETVKRFNDEESEEFLNEYRDVRVVL